MNEFKSKSVPWLKEYLTNSGFQVSDQGNRGIVGTEEYTAEDMESFKSLHGHKLFSDGHVQDCVTYCAKYEGYTLFRFKMQPTERSKTEDNISV